MKIKCIKTVFLIGLFLSAIIGGFASISESYEDMMNDQYSRRREEMVSGQLEARGISDQDLLEAFREVKRHLFVPKEYREFAYTDQPLSIGHGQTISQPYIVAYMTEALDLEENDKVLEIGTGSGYQAAILAELADEVYSVEIVEDLGEKARRVLDRLGYENVHIRVGDGYEGWAENAPYDAVIVTCSPTSVPRPLKEQLADGGRMIIPVGRKYAQELVLLRKEGGELIEESVLPVRFVPMVDEQGDRY